MVCDKRQPTNLLFRDGTHLLPIRNSMSFGMVSSHCTAGQCLPLRRKFMECSIIHPAISLLMKHLVIDQHQKAPNFSAFHWSRHGSLVSTGQHFVTTRVVHLPKRTETSLITESDQSGPNHQQLQLCTALTAWTESDQAVRAVHSCKSWFSVADSAYFGGNYWKTPIFRVFSLLLFFFCFFVFFFFVFGNISS